MSWSLNSVEFVQEDFVTRGLVIQPFTKVTASYQFQCFMFRDKCAGVQSCLFPLFVLRAYMFSAVDVYK